MTPSADWAAGPAKWAAVAVLGGAGLFGVGRSVLTDRQHAPIRPVATQTVVIPARAVEAAPAFASVDGPSERSGTPAVHASKPESVSEPSSQPLTASDSIAVRIAINSASSGELQMLPRIGPVLAQRIMDDRGANGPFRSLADLQRVRGIGPKTAEQLAPLVRFD